MRQRFDMIFRRTLLGSRWGMAPLCLGLIGALLLVLVQFFRELVEAVLGFSAMRGPDVILVILKLVDLMLVANLVLLIIDAGVEIFLPTATEDQPRPTGAGIAEFAALKPKLFASIAAIAAVDLLESFINIDTVDKASLMWEIATLLTFVVAGVLLAVMDRLSAERH